MKHVLSFQIHEDDLLQMSGFCPNTSDICESLETVDKLQSWDKNVRMYMFIVCLIL